MTHASPLRTIPDASRKASSCRHSPPISTPPPEPTTEDNLRQPEALSPILDANPSSLLHHPHGGNKNQPPPCDFVMGVERGQRRKEARCWIIFAVGVDACCRFDQYPVISMAM